MRASLTASASVVLVGCLVASCGSSASDDTSPPANDSGGTTSAIGGSSSGSAGHAGTSGAPSIGGHGASGTSGSSGSAGASVGGSGGSVGSAGTSGKTGGSGASGESGNAGIGGSAAGAGGSVGGATLGGNGGSSGSTGALSCSTDGTAVVDASGDIITMCSDADACFNGACIDACDASKAQSSNLGCSFWAPTPRTIGTKYSTPSLQPCFAVFLANDGKLPVTIGVTLGTASYDATTFARVPVSGMPPTSWPLLDATGIPVGGVSVLFLSADPNAVFQETMSSLACPVATATGAASGVEGSDIGDGFHIVTSLPVSAYDTFPFGGASSFFPSGQTLFPEGAWGTSYVVMGPPVGTSDPAGPMFVQVLAAEDATDVTIAPTVDLPASGTVPAIPKGTKQTFTLDAGQYVQWEWDPSTGQDGSGSIVASTNPVSVTSGTRFLRLQPTPAPGGETSHNQVRPVSSLGFDYAIGPFETRRADLMPEDIDYRIVGIVTGTTLTFDPPIAGAPATADQAQVIDFSTNLPFRVKSQDSGHPFAVAQLMTTANVPGGSRSGATATGSFMLTPPYPLGDEEFVPLLPPDQFRSSYVFFDDPSYSTTNLSVTRRRTSQGFSDVTIDCLGVLSGWLPIGTSGDYEYTSVDLIRADVANGTCAHGRQAAESDGAFGLIVWGLDTYASYGYLAGGNASKLTDVVTKP